MRTVTVDLAGFCPEGERGGREQAEHIRRVLESRTRIVEQSENRTAAVLLPLVLVGDCLLVLFTRRSRHLLQHAGEISLPGGACDEGEDVISAALRETSEEVGIAPEMVEVLGLLDDEISVSHFRVTPVVGLIRSLPESFTISEGEVEELFAVPVSHLKNDDIQWKEVWIRHGEVRTLTFFRHRSDIIWGLTGRILSTFFDAVSVTPKKIMEK